MTPVEFLVIGSGPASAAACQALMDSGKSVTVVDIGSELEEQRKQVVARMGDQAPSAWAATDREFISGGMKPTLKGVDVKTTFGSKYPYYQSSPNALLGLGGSLLGASQSLGGFSSVWGAATLPFVREDMTGWPDAIDLDRYYGLVQRVMPVAAHSDDFSNHFPLAAPTVAGIPLGPDLRALRADIEKHRARFHAARMLFGLGRVAVGVPGTDQQRNSCRLCGFCMNGCPYGLIFNSRDVVRRGVETGKLQYLGGLEVERIDNQQDGGVAVHCSRRATGETVVLRARKVLLGAGVVPTAWIVAASLDLPRLDLAVKDACYFLVPFLRFRGVRDFRDGGFTLVQGFLQFEPGAVGRRRINLQVYGYNDLFESLVNSLFARFFGNWQWPREMVLSRLLLMQGYLHSDESPTISLSLTRTEGARYAVQTVADPQSSAKALVRRTIFRLIRHANILGGIPAVPLVKVEHPGRGFHFGGTFPMRERRANRFETNIWGQLEEMPNVHIVDASVFPSIPPTTITLPMMANAYRIALAAAQGTI